MTALQKIVKEAKAIKRKFPKRFSTWREYVSQASAIYASKHKGKSPVGKKHKKVAKVGKVKKKVAKKTATKKSYHKDTKSHNVNIRVVSGLGELFDISVIKDIDSLKKQYFKLAKKYHPDAGGTKEQFQQLQNEYEKLLKKVLAGSNLTEEQKKNELDLDKAMVEIVNSIAGLEGITIELVGKWLWIGGNTYPVRGVLQSVGLKFIKKEGKGFWVYKGVESHSRGDMTMEEIRKKYGSEKISPMQKKKLTGIGTIPLTKKTKFRTALKKLIKHINKRPI